MEPLRALGIEPAIGHAAANVPAGAEVVYSSAVARRRTPSAASAAAAAAPLRAARADRRAEALPRRLRRRTARPRPPAMIVHVLRGCGLDPAYAVGGELRSTGLNADWGAGEWIVIEADESDRSLLNYEPEIAVLTNAELDHHSTYSSRLDLERDVRRVHRPRAHRGRLGPARAAGDRRRRGRGRALRRRDCPSSRPPGARFSWRGRRGAARGARAAQRRQRRRRAHAPAPPPAPIPPGRRGDRRLSGRAPAHGAARRDALPGPGSTTTTPTTRRRWRPRSPAARVTAATAAGRRLPAAPLLAHARARA